MSPKSLPLTPHLTRGYQLGLDLQLRASFVGQAHFSGSGPAGSSCAGCLWHGDTKVRRSRQTGAVVEIRRVETCAKYRALTGRYGSEIPPDAAACRHFTDKPTADDFASRRAAADQLFRQPRQLLLFPDLPVTRKPR